MDILTENYKLYLGDCLEVMDRLIEEGVQVDLTVTSPPYDDLRDYNGTLAWNFDVFKQIADRLYKITKEGGVVVWVVGDKTKNGSETGTSFKQALYFKEIGFNLHDTMIYEKASRIPTQDRYYNVFEYMFVFSKGKPKTLNFICDHKNVTCGAKKQKDKCINKGKNEKSDKYHITQEYSRRSNIWRYGTGLPKDLREIKSKTGLKHPAIMPEQLAQDHILSWSNEGDLVLDCFMGSNTTGKMALLNNRKYIGIEKVEEYFEISIKRVEGIVTNN